jgi:hypothetical protein
VDRIEFIKHRYNLVSFLAAESTQPFSIRPPQAQFDRERPPMTPSKTDEVIEENSLHTKIIKRRRREETGCMRKFLALYD